MNLGTADAKQQLPLRAESINPRVRVTLESVRSVAGHHGVELYITSYLIICVRTVRGIPTYDKGRMALVRRAGPDAYTGLCAKESRFVKRTRSTPSIAV